MKKLLLAMALPFSFAYADDAVLRVATDGTYPPFAEVNSNGEMIGFDIDIAKALCTELKRKCEFYQIDWDGLIPSLINEKIDAIIASMNATEERKKVISFTKPYYRNPGVFVRAKGSAIELTKEGLKGKTIGVLTASIFDNYATDKFSKWAKIVRYNSQDDINTDAKKGVVDVLFADKIVLNEGFLERDIGKNFEQFGPEIFDEKYFGEGTSIGVRKNDTELREALNQALDNILKNGEYKKVNDKYFSYDIYNIDQ